MFHLKKKICKKKAVFEKYQRNKGYKYQIYS